MTALPRIIAITGATGNQGGSVARHLLNYPEKYRVRAVTRNLRSKAAQDLAEMGAELIQADLTKQETLPVVVKGCWGVFGVTNFYDSVSSIHIFFLPSISLSRNSRQEGRSLLQNLIFLLRNG
jgi:uncharacterized protein YbjT (DUF2867 family)